MNALKRVGAAWWLTLGLLTAKMVGAPLPWLWVFAPVWLTLVFLTILATLYAVFLVAEAP